MMELNESLAVARLRQWAFLRCATRHGKTSNYRRSGWIRRSDRKYDGQQVTVIDFERALNRLDEDEQVALVHRYRDGESDEHIARNIGCSTRKVGYLVPAARRKLADILDRLDLL
jgi:DNA-directed RNA polymerase specialized sigma24 family protein